MATNTKEASIHVVDFRSDALSKPNDGMRQAIASAVVGDAVFNEDPTVIALQEMVASLLGKEAGLYVPSGTMSNLICVLNHCWGRGTEVILGDQSHIYVYEQGGIAQLGGVHPRVIPNREDGTFDLTELRGLVRPDDQHFPITTLVCIENTHNLKGGNILPLEWVDQLGEVCKDLGLPLHMDGARILNASVATGIAPARLVRACDSVSLCLSKGIGAPVGSVLVGTKDFVKRAERLRKVLGGGMRQAGLLAAAGIYGLERYADTLATDHRHARTVATAVADLKSAHVSVQLDKCQTNIVFLDCNGEVNAVDLMKRLEDPGSTGISVKALTMSPKHLRLVLSWNNSNEDVDAAIKKLTHVIKSI